MIRTEDLTPAAQKVAQENDLQSMDLWEHLIAIPDNLLREVKIPAPDVNSPCQANDNARALNEIIRAVKKARNGVQFCYGQI